MDWDFAIAVPRCWLDNYRSCDAFDQFVAGREYKMDIELLIQVGVRWFQSHQSAIVNSRFDFLFCWISVEKLNGASLWSANS